MGIIGIAGIMTIDIVTFVAAISALLFVRIPQPIATEEGRKGQGSLWQESLYGFRYILERPSLLGLQLVFFAGNFVSNIGYTVLAPMILARTSNNAGILGSVQSVGAIGGVVGGLLLSVWGGPKRRVHGVFLGWAFFSLMGMMLMGLGRGLLVWVVAAFCGPLTGTIIDGSNQAIWQAKVAPDVQGRVFSVRRLIAQVTGPVAMLLAGPLADRLFEPAMRAEAAPFGWLVGTGPGAGMALMLVISGILGTLVGLGAYAFPAVRNVESIMPDHDALPMAVSAPVAAAAD
jgi:Major Facilitator Superfamily